MTQFMKKLCAALTLTFCFFAATDSANAQNLSRGKGIGQSGSGTDVWTTTMAGLGLFRAHRDDCNATTEVFVKIYTNSSSIDFGFCIDKDEHSVGALEFEDARQKCLDGGKRLPEPPEFKYVCDSVSGLNDMLDDAEWSSNFVVPLYGSSSSGIAAAYSGYQTCKKATWTWTSNSTGNNVASLPFRCVR